MHDSFHSQSGLFHAGRGSKGMPQLAALWQPSTLGVWSPAALAYNQPSLPKPRLELAALPEPGGKEREYKSKCYPRYSPARRPAEKGGDHRAASPYEKRNQSIVTTKVEPGAHAFKRVTLPTDGGRGTTPASAAGCLP